MLDAEWYEKCLPVLENTSTWFHACKTYQVLTLHLQIHNPHWLFANLSTLQVPERETNILNAILKFCIDQRLFCYFWQQCTKDKIPKQSCETQRKIELSKVYFILCLAVPILSRHNHLKTIIQKFNTERADRSEMLEWEKTLERSRSNWKTHTSFGILLSSKTILYAIGAGFWTPSEEAPSWGSKCTTR